MKKQNDLETTGKGNVVRQDGFSEPEKTETGAGDCGWYRYNRDRIISLWFGIRFATQVDKNSLLIVMIVVALSVIAFLCVLTHFVVHRIG